MNPRDFALDLLGRHPGIGGNPNARHMIEVIRRGDAEEGQRIAQNICDTYGIKPEDATAQARRFFGL